MDALGLPVRIIITQGTTHDVTQSEPLIKDIEAKHLLADKAYDSNALISKLTKQKTAVVIPYRKNRKEQRSYDSHLYQFRHLIENAFLHLKRWRGIATRYAKKTSSFLAAVQIRCMMLWLY